MDNLRYYDHGYNAMNRIRLSAKWMSVFLIVILSACKSNEIKVPTNDFIVLGESLKLAVKPVVIQVRFSNPVYLPENKSFIVDVDFKADTSGQQVYGMNVRFWFDSSQLKFLRFSDFVGSYNPISPNPPQAIETPYGNWFGFRGGATFVNGAFMLNDKNVPVYLDNWKRLFRIYFETKQTPVIFNPAMVWDIEQNPANGGFLRGCQGIVIVIVNTTNPLLYSWYSDEYPVHLNWVYTGTGAIPYGRPLY